MDGSRSHSVHGCSKSPVTTASSVGEPAARHVRDGNDREGNVKSGSAAPSSGRKTASVATAPGTTMPPRIIDGPSAGRYLSPFLHFTAPCPRLSARSDVVERDEIHVLLVDRRASPRSGADAKVPQDFAILGVEDVKQFVGCASVHPAGYHHRFAGRAAELTLPNRLASLKVEAHNRPLEERHEQEVAVDGWPELDGPEIPVPNDRAVARTKRREISGSRSDDPPPMHQRRCGERSRFPMPLRSAGRQLERLHRISRRRVDALSHRRKSADRSERPVSTSSCRRRSVLLRRDRSGEPPRSSRQRSRRAGGRCRKCHRPALHQLAEMSLSPARPAESTDSADFAATSAHRGLPRGKRSPQRPRLGRKTYKILWCRPNPHLIIASPP